ncbi:gem-associated protein [Anaeramoeba flamelloides]|uniref:Gem-associated protein n=1 Tax=Anaeramoeba flamelloides TaxID=1746091 RepID=A0AAV7ZLR0_9EUKA|nr:gem-associated protein [Anaeramoeba flamelloides]KAJ6232781.1 gem-associated protein [Anaeramoeba flamelloides]
MTNNELINKYVQLSLQKHNTTIKGYLFTIDPETSQHILINEERSWVVVFPDAIDTIEECLPPKHFTCPFDEEAINFEDLFTSERIQNPEQREETDKSESDQNTNTQKQDQKESLLIQQRKKQITEIAKKFYWPVLENGSGRLCILDTLYISPPYYFENITCLNEMVTMRVTTMFNKAGFSFEK